MFKELIYNTVVLFIIYCTWKPFIAFDEKVIDMWSEDLWGVAFYLFCLFGTVYATYLIVQMRVCHDLAIRNDAK